MGHAGAAGERQEDPSKDQEIQDQTRSDEAFVPGGQLLLADSRTFPQRKDVGELNFNCGSLQDEESFNPDYVEVDRILDVSHSLDKDNGEVGDRSLVRSWFKMRPKTLLLLCLV